MFSINYCLDKLGQGALEQHRFSEKLSTLNREEEYEKMLFSAEKSTRSASALYLMNRELLLTFYELAPWLPPSVDVDRVESETLGVSVEKVPDFDFPVYKITLPFLLPNKRKRNVDFGEAVTGAVARAVINFCSENIIVSNRMVQNRILPFESATLIFVTATNGIGRVIDNDNKESAIITNGLIGFLIRDDHPHSCNTIYCSRYLEGGTKTEIYVVESSHDVEVYAKIKS